MYVYIHTYIALGIVATHACEFIIIACALDCINILTLVTTTTLGLVCMLKSVCIPGQPQEIGEIIVKT